VFTGFNGHRSGDCPRGDGYVVNGFRSKLGGKSPVIVCKTRISNKAVPVAAMSVFAKLGSDLQSPDRGCFVAREIHE